MEENFYVTGGDIPDGERQELGEVIERLFPTDVLITLDRNRPYNGQAWTDDGERGKHNHTGHTRIRGRSNTRKYSVGEEK